MTREGKCLLMMGFFFFCGAGGARALAYCFRWGTHARWFIIPEGLERERVRVNVGGDKFIW